VELFVNRTSLGTTSGDDIHRFIGDVSLSEGPTKVRAVAVNKDKTLCDQVIWTVSRSATTRYATPGMIETTAAIIRQKKKPATASATTEP
jgi:hypothetical protein